MGQRPPRYDIDDPRSHMGPRVSGKRSRRDMEEDEPVDREKERMDRIHQLLVRIGERSSSTLAHNLNELSKVLLVDISHYREFIIDTLFQCVTNLTVKIPIYATLVGLINATQSDFGSDIVNRLVIELESSFIVNEKFQKEQEKYSEEKSDTNNNNNSNSNTNANDSSNYTSVNSSPEKGANYNTHSPKSSRNKNQIRPTLESGLAFDFNRIRLLVCIQFLFYFCLYFILNARIMNNK